jgi:dienelactone hydrolase
MRKTILMSTVTALSLTVSAVFGQLKPVAYADGAQKLSGLSISPAKATMKKAGVLILPAWKGIDKHAKNTALELSKLGYYAFVADIYGEGNYPADDQGAGKLAGYYKKNVSAYHSRIKVALNQLIKAGADPSRIVVMGYCFGGTGAIEAARVNMPVRAAVSIHGGLDRDSSRTIEPIKPKLLILHGADDPMAPPATILALEQEMRTAKADWQMIFYGNAVHSFSDPDAGNDNSKGVAYNELAAKRSWEHLKIFLTEIFAN